MTKKQLYTKLLGKSYYYEGQVPANIDIGYYYKVNVGCLNCNEVYNVYIRKGKYVKDVSPQIKCKNCSCSLKECSCNTCN
jgi:hypothetical protein